MVSGAGHVIDMINRMKQNKAITKHGKFREHNRKTIYAQHEKVEYDFKKVYA